MYSTTGIEILCSRIGGFDAYVRPTRRDGRTDLDPRKTVHVGVFPTMDEARKAAVGFCAA